VNFEYGLSILVLRDRAIRYKILELAIEKFLKKIKIFSNAAYEKGPPHKKLHFFLDMKLFANEISNTDQILQEGRCAS
jgi:hypothetical protein